MKKKKRTFGRKRKEKGGGGEMTEHRSYLNGEESKERSIRIDIYMKGQISPWDAYESPCRFPHISGNKD